jgi:cysteinyl-tRNA synthetase
MSRKYLGNSFDIHGGGKDLVFPHHENELAQSEGASGEEFVKYWVHHGFVTIKDEKMSKSLGNFLTIREVIDKFPPEALRLFIFSTHYRNPLDYSEAALLDAVAGLNRLYTCLAEIEQLPAAGNDQANSAVSKADREKIETLAERFIKAMDNDFNSAQALGHLFDAVKILNKIRQHLPGKPASLDLQLLKAGAKTAREMANTLGLLSEEPLLYMQKEQEKILKTLSVTPEEIEKNIADRTAAREAKEWARADEIRDLLLSQGIELKDGPTGTTWQVKLP